MRVCDLPQLLQISQIRGEAGLQVCVTRSLDNENFYNVKRCAVTFDNCSAICSIAKDSPMTMFLIGTCSSLEAAEVQKLRQIKDMPGNNNVDITGILVIIGNVAMDSRNTLIENKVNLLQCYSKLPTLHTYFIITINHSSLLQF